MQRLTAKELQRRYRAGERNFAEVDLSGESLRGMNLKGIDLSGADLSRTDVRGTRLVDANLQGTCFTQANAGLQKRWVVGHLVLNLLLTVLFNLSSAGLSAVAIIVAFTPDFVADYTIIVGSIILPVTLGMFAVIALQGLTFKAFSTILVLIGVAGAVAGAVAGGAAGGLAVTIAFISASAVVFAGTGAFAGAVVGTVASAGGVVIAVIIAVLFVGTSLSLAEDTGQFSDASAVVVAGAFVVAVAGTSLSCYMILLALKGDEKFSVVRVFALAIGAVGSTSFAGADLTGAYFAQAILKNANFANSRQRSTILTNVRWKDVKKLDRARVGNSILQHPQVRDLLVTLNGSEQNFSNTNLRGTNLADAKLVMANFTGAILSEAMLSEADLHNADLSEASCIGTDFSSAHFTGATLEAWNIESSTCLDNVHCDYVYLLRNQQERRPSSGTFAPGEFSKLFQEVLDTIDLIFQNGVDWKAFVRTFNDVQGQYGDANLAVQAIENKGDGVVVVKLNAAPGVDKPAIHQSFTEIYQLALQEAEARYKAQLDAKDDQIADYRQQSANMQEVVKLLAQRPINVDVKATAESKAMQGNDNSRNISIGGNATGNVFQTGDGNTAELRQVTLPPPDRVNIQAELVALKDILAGLNDPVTTGIAAKLDEEATNPAPDKSVVATTLETGLTYARNLQGFAEAIDQLRPHVQNAAGWLGEHGTKLLPLVGLVL